MEIHHLIHFISNRIPVCQAYSQENANKHDQTLLHVQFTEKPLSVMVNHVINNSVSSQYSISDLPLSNESMLTIPYDRAQDFR